MTRPCDACAGEGRVYYIDRSEACPMCGGRGLLPDLVRLETPVEGTAPCAICKAPAGAPCYDFCPTRRKWKPLRVRTVSDIGALCDVVDILLDHAPQRARERVELLLEEKGL